MDADEQKVKHLEMIQAVISRMAGNSFAIKGWSITLVSALFALAANDTNARYAALALLPALCFWGLDAYYLRQERLFRKLYDAVRTGQLIGTPPAAVKDFSMNTRDLEASVDSWVCILKSRSIFWLHAPIVLAVVIVTVVAATR